ARSRPRRATQAAAIAAAGLCLALATPTTGPASAAPSASAKVATQIADVQRKLAALNMKIEATVEEYNSARLTLAGAKRKAAAASAKAERARVAYQGKRTMLSGYAASAYRSGPDGSLAAIVSSTPAEYLDRLQTLDAVGHRQSEIVTATDIARQQYAAQVTAVQTAAEAAAQVTRGIAAAKASIESQIATQRGLLAGLRAERARLLAQAARQQAVKDVAAATVTRSVVRQIDNVAVSHPAPARAASRSSSVHRTPPPASGRARAAVAAAYSVLGRPYVWGAAGSGSFDCSGLTMWSWAHTGVGLPHSSRAQYGSGAHVSKSALQPGDLLFFYSPISHVGMYIGGGRMIHAPHTGDVVRIATPQWGSFVGAVRPS
ncbi:MAG: NlpC/P60 family protein, partial [Frankiaceae bacterium]